jgi:hypothetical protein
MDISGYPQPISPSGLTEAGGEMLSDVIWGKKYKKGKRKRGEMQDKKEERGKRKKKKKKKKRN